MMSVNVAGQTDEQFEAWLVAARRSAALGTPQSLATCLLSINDDQILTIAERQDRVHRLLVFFRLPPGLVLDGWLLIANRAQSIAGSVLAYLPASLKPRAHGSGTGSGSSSAPAALVPPPGPSTGNIVGAASPAPSSVPKYNRATVVLLGDINEFGTSVALLSNNGIPHALYGSINEVDEESRLCACAIIVGRTLYRGLGSADQATLLRSIARWNSQAWIKLGFDGLATELAGNLMTLVESLGFTAARARSIIVTERSELVQGELGYIFPHADQVESCLDYSLLVDGLSEQQALLVSLAVRQELSAARLDHLISKTISVQVNRGRSASSILICRVKGCSHPFILRLGSRSDLLDGAFAELPKIERLILPWNPAVMPSVYSIGDDAILVYNSVRSAENPDRAARTLAEYLDDLQAGEPPDPPPGLPLPDRLKAAIDDAFSVLLGLNRTSVSQQRATYSYVLEHYQAMASSGKTFRLREGDPVDVVEKLLGQAISICEGSIAAAVVHGDPHTKNVVLPTSSHAELIDFERAQVGHPLYDTCHLLLSLCATSYRSYASFDETVELFHNCLFGDESAAAAMGSCSNVNAVIAQGLTSAKRTASALISHYHLSTEHFPAMLTIVCCMALMYLPQLHSEVAKALICASMQELPTSHTSPRSEEALT